MQINQNIYPYNLEVRKLPIHLTGIGGSPYQYHVTRTEGYHWHQILFSAEEDGVLKYDNVTVPIDKGDFFFLPAGYPHEYYPSKKLWNVRWVAFDGYASLRILSQFDMTKPIVIKPQDSSALQLVYNKMFSAQKNDKDYCDFLCSGLIYEYIIEFHRLMDTKSNRARSKRSQLLEPVFNYIDENFYLDFSLTTLAEHAGISPQYLCRIFKETMNLRPMEYITKRRLQESKRLLQENKLSVSEIALQSGFPDAGYFSTVFRKYEGLSPMEYRKQIGKA